MKITNLTGLPEIMEVWAKADTYKRGDADFTTTQLPQPPRILALRRRHWDEITLDITDLTSRLDGQAKHVVFQRIGEQDPERYIVEHRYTMPVAGAVISGQLDLYDRKTETLYDYKSAKVWKKILGDDSDWTQQANINAFLVQNVGNFPVKHLVNIVFFKDHTIRQAQRDPEYPQKDLVAWPLELWDANKTLQYIQLRVAIHQAAAQGGNGVALPLCTPEERWQRPAKFAVMKQGRKTAVKLFDSFIEASAFITEASDYKVLSIEERPSEDTRCKFYCECAPFCDFGRKVLGI